MHNISTTITSQLSYMTNASKASC